MRKILTSFVIGTALGASGLAFAADMPVKARAPVAPPPTWTGFYIGINGGGAWGKTETSLNALNSPVAFYNPANIPGVNRAGSMSFDDSSGIFGGQIGYLQQAGQAVLGIEAAFDWQKLKGSASVTQPYFANPQLFTINESVSSNWLFTFLGRVGWDMGSWYPYLTGGVAVSDLTYNFSYTDVVFAPGCVGCAASFSQTRWGPAVGGGVEWRWDSHWSLRGEYLFVQFQDVTGGSTLTQPFAVPGEVAGATALFNHTAKVKESIARGFLSYRF
jgi:outer membrane immunogenic protein